MAHVKCFVKERMWRVVYICCSYSKNCRSSHLGKVYELAHQRNLPQDFELQITFGDREKIENRVDK